MNEAKIAAPLLTLLGSGGTIERVLTELPMFKTQIELALDWMKSKARCTDAEVRDRVIHLREVVFKKDEAIKNQDWHVAADLRAKECAIFESFGLDCRTSVNPSASTFIPVEEHIYHLAKLLNENHESDS